MNGKLLKAALIFVILMVNLNETSSEEKEKTGFVVRTVSSMDKIFRNSFKEDWLRPGTDDEIRITAAKGESESFQIVVIPFKDLTNLRWEISSKLDIKNIKVQPVGYVDVVKNTMPRHIKGYPEEEIRTGWWPDPLFSTWQKIEKVKTDEIQPIWVTIDIPEDLKPGKYKTIITLFADGTNKAQVTVNLKVWDFKLPERTSLKTSFWYAPHQLAVYYPEKANNLWETEKKFLKMALDNRITPHVFGLGALVEISFNPETKAYSFDFSKFKRFLNLVFEENERKGNYVSVVSHHFGYGNIAPFNRNRFNLGDKLDFRGERFFSEEYKTFLIQYLSAARKFLTENNWLKYAYLYYLDEPLKDSWERPKWIYPIIKKIFPELKTLAATNYQPSVQALKDYIDIMVPGLFSNFTSANLKEFQQLQEEGREVWGYVCYKTADIDYQSIDHRIWTWLCWKYNLKGFIHWAIYNWMQRGGPQKRKEMFVRDPQDRWPYKAKWESMDFEIGVAGDGHFIYPSPEGEPWSSIRLENIRDGIEDYEYFHILKDNLERLGKKGKRYQQIVREGKELLEIGPEIIKDPVEYTRDFKKILERREKVGRMIEKTNRMLRGQR